MSKYQIFLYCSYVRARPLKTRNELMKGSFSFGETPIEYKTHAMH